MRALVCMFVSCMYACMCYQRTHPLSATSSWIWDWDWDYRLIPLILQYGTRGMYLVVPAYSILFTSTTAFLWDLLSHRLRPYFVDVICRVDSEVVTSGLLVLWA
jgi:hypothetical protein